MLSRLEYFPIRLGCNSVAEHWPSMREAQRTQVNPKQRQLSKAAQETSLVCGKYILKYNGFVN